MYVRRIATVALMMLCAFSGGAFMTWLLTDQPAYAQSTKYSQSGWEYKREAHTIFSDTDGQFQKALSESAQEGWELIQVNEGTGYSNKVITYWKRPKTSLSY